MNFGTTLLGLLCYYYTTAMLGIGNAMEMETQGVHGTVVQSIFHIQPVIHATPTPVTSRVCCGAITKSISQAKNATPM